MSSSGSGGEIVGVGPSNWQKACFVPAKADTIVVAFRMWLKKYAGGQINWGTKFSGSLPSILSREQLMDRSAMVHIKVLIRLRSLFRCFRLLHWLLWLQLNQLPKEIHLQLLQFCALWDQNGCHTSFTKPSIFMTTITPINERFHVILSL
ncbi:putative pheophorbide a oxygenase [Helianthus annuus]|uniref:Pheophorbide a oxygenase n=1 Tax=Helianthus annuus TaxID=4232 RepID=A0A251SFT4_HELAN|nr:uncharacterized protein LOC110905517 isoform X1 [Helianthus annuus]KAF5768221.1 putative pheophorbide a oxygenase [Helianthus annuus]KAJ0839527.1 putative pheophorbide a oxygenase [Helianthus annuus]